MTEFHDQGFFFVQRCKQQEVPAFETFEVRRPGLPRFSQETMMYGMNALVHILILFTMVEAINVRHRLSFCSLTSLSSPRGRTSAKRVSIR